MSKLYEWPPTRSNRAKWVLEELKIPYESHLVDMTNGEQLSASYRKIHPLGVVPAFACGNYHIFESIAIVLQLADEHPEAQLAPQMTDPKRASYYQWCIFAASELDPNLMLFFDHKLRPKEGLREPQVIQDPHQAELGRLKFGERARILTDHFESQQYILGSTFTAADICIGHSCFMAKLMGLLSDFPVLEQYLDLLSQRPGYQKAYGG